MRTLVLEHTTKPSDGTIWRGHSRSESHRDWGLKGMLRSVSAAVALCVFVHTSHAEIPGVVGTFPCGSQSGQTTRFIVYGSIGTAPTELWCDRADLTIQVTDKPNEWTIAVPADTPPGIAWLRWHNAEGASELRPFVISQLPEIVETEPNNKATEAQKIAALPCVVNGRLEKRNEVDNYAISLKAGETLVAWVQANSLLPSPMDASLQITDARGFVMEQNDDWLGNDPRLAWTAPADGTWHVRMFAFPAQTDSSINYAGGENYFYRLSLTTGPALDYMVPLVRQVGTVTPQGWNLPSGPLLIEGTAPQLRLLPLSNGSHAVATFPWHELPEPIGQTVIEEPHAENQIVTIPSTITGTLDTPGDIDRYQFSTTKGQKLRIHTVSRTLGSEIDPRIRILTSDGKSLSEQDDEGNSADPSFSWAAPADGTYTIELTDRFTAFGPHHFYSLVIEPELPGFEISVAANRFTLDRTKPLEIPVTINRIAGLNVPIQFTVEGLPAGVTLEAAESKPEGDSAKKVTLKLSVAADAAAARGPIQITGRSTGPDLIRSAEAPIDGVKSTTKSLWLTLPPQPK